ncbi:hypothetical protein M3Y97_00783200 [Aphelenchoides bicaudatus]|nr:hypothetical protein M3Y97_00783200 [Aphelenchoides bicaudatus]
MKPKRTLFYLIFSIFLITFANSATLVDSEDGIKHFEETQSSSQSSSQTTETSQQDEEINKLLMIKNLLNARKQARALASNTFSSQRATFDSKNAKIDTFDLHTAYRLPLHRLSDAQLSILLHKYADPNENNEQLSRDQVITKLQELITKDDKMLRPRLLTNVNVMNLNDLTLQQTVVNANIERTTVGPLQAINMQTEEPRYQATLLVNNDDVETTEQPATTETTNESTTNEVTLTPEVQTTFEAETTSQPIESTTDAQTTTTQLHKELPIETQPQKSKEADEESLMREKNNRLHSEYIQSLSNDLQRLKIKYDIMKLEFLRALRRINERNINKSNRVNQAAAPTFIVSTKDSWETSGDGKSGGLSAEKPIKPIVEVDKISSAQEVSSESTTQIAAESTTVNSVEVEQTSSSQEVSSESTTQTSAESTVSKSNQTDKPFGAETIELELLANQKIAKEMLSNFSKATNNLAEQHNLTTTTIDSPTTTEAATTKLLDDNSASTTSNKFLLDSDKLTIKPLISTPKPETKVQLEKLLENSPLITHSNGIHQHISTVELDKLDNDSPRTLVSKPSAQVSSSASGEAPTESTQPINTTPKAISMMEAVSQFEKELTNPMMWIVQNEKMQKSKNHENFSDNLIILVKQMEKQSNNNATEQAKIQVKLKRIDESITTADLIDRLQEEAKEKSNKSVSVAGNIRITNKCRSVTCDFEGNPCLWQSSLDKFSAQKYLLSNRHRRQVQFTTRSWQVRNGNNAQNQTIDKSEMFSSTNKRFLSTYLKPQQKAILTAQLPKTHNQKFVLNFNSWEATRDIKLKGCCGSLNNCPFETDMGLKRGTRKWLNQQLICPSGTNQILFECMNYGHFQGVCGLDNIELVGEQCASTKPTKSYLHDGGSKQR